MSLSPLYPNVLVYFGPMYSGKSTELKAKVQFYVKYGYKVLYVRYTNDVREYDTHSSAVYDHKCDIIRANMLSQITNTNYDVIAIDEAHFFPDLPEFVESHLNKVLIIAGLVKDYKGNKFGKIPDIIYHMDNPNHTAICATCLREGNHTPAAFSKRLVQSDQLELIGDKEYEPVCRRHFNYA